VPAAVGSIAIFTLGPVLSCYLRMIVVSDVHVETCRMLKIDVAMVCLL
jgi:hypothetical protein